MNFTVILQILHFRNHVRNVRNVGPLKLTFVKVLSGTVCNSSGGTSDGAWRAHHRWTTMQVEAYESEILWGCFRGKVPMIDFGHESDAVDVLNCFKSLFQEMTSQILEENPLPLATTNHKSPFVASFVVKPSCWESIGVIFMSSLFRIDLPGYLTEEHEAWKMWTKNGHEIQQKTTYQRCPCEADIPTLTSLSSLWSFLVQRQHLLEFLHKT